LILLLLILPGSMLPLLVSSYGRRVIAREAKKVVPIMANVAEHRTTKGQSTRSLVELTGVGDAGHMGRVASLKILVACLWIYLLVEYIVRFLFI
jgi:hypothetical protein